MVFALGPPHATLSSHSSSVGSLERELSLEDGEEDGRELDESLLVPSAVPPALCLPSRIACNSSSSGDQVCMAADHAVPPMHIWKYDTLCSMLASHKLLLMMLCWHED